MKQLLAIQVTTAGGSIIGIISAVVILAAAWIWWNHMMNKD
jgi:hypothetical protein